jgi:hypothetical protein
MVVDDLAFARFLALHKRDLQRISRHTSGESSTEDVQAEAWLMIHELARKGVEIDLNVAEHRSTLLAHLYQHLVRYTELQVRHAVRLDHAPGGEEGQANPLLDRLAASEQYDPVVALMRAEEEQAPRDAIVTAHRSLASAYLHLLQRFDNRMRDVAHHLMISVSYCYKRCADARILAMHQECLPAPATPQDTSFVPGPWRPYRILRAPRQLCLDFGEHEPLFQAPQ